MYMPPEKKPVVHSNGMTSGAAVVAADPTAKEDSFIRKWGCSLLYVCGWSKRFAPRLGDPVVGKSSSNLVQNLSYKL